MNIKLSLGRMIGKLNGLLEGQCFILVGPGRWGSSNIDLGVPVSYGEIYNARVLVEVALPMGNVAPEASYGTHFFQDLVESNIYPLPIYPGERGAFIHYDFFRSAKNMLPSLLNKVTGIEDYIKVVDIKQATYGKTLEIVMNSREEKALGYLTMAHRRPYPSRVYPIRDTDEYKELTSRYLEE